MNVDTEILKQTGQAIEKSAQRIKRIMANMPQEEWGAAIANDEAKKAEVRAKIDEEEAKKAEAIVPITRNMDMTILGVSSQQPEQEAGHHK
jgi:hypothetical protein